MDTDAESAEHSDSVAARPRLRRDVQRSRERLIASARDVFAAQGLAAGLNEVASHAGVGVGTVYRHFPDKQELIEVALNDAFESLIALMERNLEINSPWRALERALRDSVAMAVANRGLRDLTFLSSRGRESVQVERARLNPLIERMLHAARVEGELRQDVVVDDLVMIMLMVSDFAYRSEAVRPGAYRRYLDMLIEGLRKPQHGDEIIAPMSPEEAAAVANRWAPQAR
ncbi:TetR/AcrR family transcriptional regulator [Cryobacterium adonitolivorans]|uniref:TetR/AcrR family transcriptional regulator n=1 Tax=Cryobacterium adonitolivorans TaxID=1259189 RepID=A0A4R8WB37_9MICO|nr:TetR/AcrR family transcriptional regulator [Cryobacterium adonitolivorans]TFC04093.1 TetR/AcrR family transcriptional regulator [Cryobacterium adonitolivorans]